MRRSASLRAASGQVDGRRRPPRWFAALSNPWLQGVFLTVLSMGYRITYVREGLNGVDEGWVQSMGARIVAGQLPYRDFHYTYGPVTIYLQALLIHTFGDAYTLLASRLFVSAEATLATLLGLAVLRRYVSPLQAFLITIPTVFFTIILYYFATYTYDAVLLALVGAALWTARGRFPRIASALAGTTIVLSASAKPQFILLLIVFPLADVLDRRPLGSKAGVAATGAAMAGGAVAAAVAVSAPFAAGHALSQYLHDSVLASHEAHPVPLSFVLWQDIPAVLRADNHAVSLAVLGVVLIGCVSLKARAARWSPLLVLGLLATLVILATGSNTGFTTTQGQAHVLYVGLVLLMLINMVMLVTLTVRSFAEGGPAPDCDGLRPSLPLLALSVQVLAQVNYSGIINGYIGTFLSLPSALAFLVAARQWRGFALGRVIARIPHSSAAVVGAWFAIAGFVVTRSFTYLDGPRADLVVSLHGHKLDGIVASASAASGVAATLELIDRKTHPGDPILVLPDWSILYFLTDRTDPTRLTWYDPGLVTATQVSEAAADLERQPARLIIVENSDFLETSALYAPLMSVIRDRYVRTMRSGAYAIYEPQPPS